ncbi:hypothetical protein [Cohnella fermenti]|uniref:Uncharacterized protein n=1 Tax=Cohnella fermenti TaxID=2565925 RepID=A0A4S4BIN5_9BACL|nr:hypothetical protein [Cohnella fermenti]THF74373.1 hypothetical protein E6C55_25355 [Cohnella fermenti]
MDERNQEIVFDSQKMERLMKREAVLQTVFNGLIKAGYTREIALNHTFIWSVRSDPDMIRKYKNE